MPIPLPAALPIPGKRLAIELGAAAILAAAIAALWFWKEKESARAELEAANAATAKAAAEQSKFALGVLRGQMEGGQAVADKVLQALQAQQLEAAQRQRRILNAPLDRDNNGVIPGVLADYYDELQRRAPAGPPARAGRSAGP